MLHACLGQPVDRPPLWMMRQAGRYLPEYLELRKAHSFWDILRTPRLALEVASQPMRRFDLDATILFSDILVLLDAMGGDVRYEPKGPVITRPFESHKDLARVEATNVADELSYVGEGLAMLASAFQREKAVIGFAGAPLTLAGYFVEGGPKIDLRHLKALSYREPDLIEKLLGVLAEKVADLLTLQVEAGAHMVQLFDSWAGLLSPEDYERLALPAVARIAERIRPTGVPLSLYIRGAASHLEAAQRSGATVLSIDSSVSMAQARQKVGTLTLQGNLDPAELLGPRDRIRRQTQKMIRQADGGGLIVNLGQGLTPDIPVEGVDAFVRAVTSLPSSASSSLQPAGDDPWLLAP